MAESRSTIIVTRARGNSEATPMDIENLPSGASGREKYKSGAFKIEGTVEDDDEENEELVPTLIHDVAKIEAVKPIATKDKTVAKPETSSKQKVNTVEPIKDSSDESNDDSDKDMEGDSDDSDDEEETQLPRKWKKVAHVTTPHPVK
ncbi:histone deacetylase HDT1-like [Impatiens glandulifera]|uniref:histone deacetylase HDT1-like n=1 Tax=Impatiens glandulifera TaxID=253017 RepID=UPI001FB0B1BF|nr:histone deacetylase HDT1-like [Impatiens glandulifera]